MAIGANTTYVVSVFSSSGDYVSDHPYFSSAHDNPPLHGLTDGADGPNGVYHEGSDEFPTDSFSSSNYWADVVFAEPDATPPVISQLTGQSVSTTSESVSWTTDEPATSRVDYGTSANSLNSSAGDPALTTAHSLTLTGLTSSTPFFFRATSADASDNSSTSPAGTDPPATFMTPAFTATDTTATDFAAGMTACSVVSHDVGPNSGEVQLNPTLGVEFNDDALPVDWQSSTVRPERHRNRWRRPADGRR